MIVAIWWCNIACLSENDETNHVNIPGFSSHNAGWNITLVEHEYQSESHVTVFTYLVELQLQQNNDDDDSYAEFCTQQRVWVFKLQQTWFRYMIYYYCSQNCFKLF